MKQKIPVGLSLPKTFVAEIDDRRGDIPRSKYVLRIIEKSIFQDNCKQNLLSQTVPKKVGHPGRQSAIVRTKPPLVVVKKDDKAQ